LVSHGGLTALILVANQSLGETDGEGKIFERGKAASRWHFDFMTIERVNVLGHDTWAKD
jgi:hypothetical protein